MESFKPIEFASSNANGPISGDGSDGSEGSGSAFFLGGSGSFGVTDSSGARFDPEHHSGRDKLNADGTFRKKRGRKPNSATGGNRKRADNSTNLESLTSILAIVHAGLASATKTPELVLELPEAEALANAAANVLIEFDIQPNPKVQAIVGLVMTAGSIYGPRVYLIRERKKGVKEDG